MTNYLYVKYNYYSNVQNLGNSRKIPTGYFRLQKKDFINLLYKHGGFSNISISENSKRLYEALFDFTFKLVEEDGVQTLMRSKDYNCSETSFKGKISFIHGMMAAIIFAEYYLNLRSIFHLTDENLEVEGEKSPDYFGIDINNKGVLLEAKGSVNIVSNSTINSASDQLGGVTEIRHKPQPFNIVKKAFSQFEKYVSTSNFNSRGEYFVNLIDPKEKGDEILSFDFNKATYLHYKYIFEFLLNNQENVEEILLDDITYLIVKNENTLIGLDNSIYNHLLDYNYAYNNVNLYELIRNVLHENYKDIYKKIEELIPKNNKDLEDTTDEDNKDENIEINTEFKKSFDVDINNEKYKTEDLTKNENIADEKDNAEPLIIDIKEFYKHIEDYEISKYGICYKELIRD